MAIQILRGNSTTRASSERVLEVGQPLYETDTHKLYVGDGTTQAKNLSCVTTDLAKNATNIKAKNGQYESLATALLEMVYPIGSIYMSVNNTSPSTFLGGTWKSWGSGRVPVGVDVNDSDFATVEKTGGIKSDSFNHSHTKIFGNDDQAYYYLRSKNIRTPSSGGNITSVASFEQYNAEDAEGPANWENIRTGRAPKQYENESTTVTTLQPYITCFMWKRTA